MAPHPNEWLTGFFRGDDVYIVGGGPSLAGFDFSRLDGRRVIATNNAIEDVKNPDILLFVDEYFVNQLRNDIGINPYSVPYRILAGPSTKLKKEHPVYIFYEATAISKNPSNLFSITHSGSAAINAAIIGGAERIFLLGFDMKFYNGMSHYHSTRRAHRHDGSQNEERYRKKIHLYEKYYQFKNIFNLSHDSALTGFNRMSLDDVL